MVRDFPECLAEDDRVPWLGEMPQRMAGNRCNGLPRKSSGKVLAEVG